MGAIESHSDFSTAYRMESPLKNHKALSSVFNLVNLMLTWLRKKTHWDLKQCIKCIGVTLANTSR